MNLSELLKPEAVRTLSSATSKKRVLQEISELVQFAYGTASETVLASLLEREALGPTGVGHGVALPHARVAGVPQVFGAFVLLDRPVDFDAVDRQPIDIAFALLAPENAGADHLKALALVSRTLRNQATCAKLRSNPDASTLYTILSEAEASQAA